MICTFANSLWLAGCLPEYARFRRAVRQVAKEQNTVLMRVLAENAGTDFGRQHKFASIRSAQEYQSRVPLRDYAAHQKWMDRAAAGEPSVLTRERIRLFEPTSGTGSPGATKLIPYTAALQREFQRGVQAWIADLFLHQPDLMNGQAYWSISPAITREQVTPGGIPVGFDDDAAYLAGWQQGLVRSTMAVPAAVRGTSEMDAFRYLTLLFLVRSRKLKLISVWNPTFLALIVDQLAECADELARDLEHGSVARGIPSLDPIVGKSLLSSLRPDKRRADDLRAAVRACGSAEMHMVLWPELALISCWADANAAALAAELQMLFPQARIQGKGLIATEGFISFPLTGHEGAALAVRSHFLEFLPVRSSGESDQDSPRLAHELDKGQRYTVVITTGGGLYRYPLGDMVEVVGSLHSCPLIRFVGRDNYVSDWFGEKLTEAHVARVLSEVFAALGMSPRFALLACDPAPPASYVLYIDTPEQDEMLDHVAARIDAGLRDNVHYDYCRELRQLGKVRISRANNAAKTYMALAVSNGQRSGDVKPLALDRHNIAR